MPKPNVVSKSRRSKLAANAGLKISCKESFPLSIRKISQVQKVTEPPAKPWPLSTPYKLTESHPAMPFAAPSTAPPFQPR
jgi:hypothetical protein